MKIKLERIVHAKEKKDCYELIVEHMHGDADMYTKENITVYSREELVLLKIILRTYQDDYLEDGIEIDKLVKTFEKIVELPEGTDKKAELEKLLRENFLLNEENEIEDELSDYLRENEIIVSDVTTQGDSYAKICDYEFIYFDENSEEYKVKEVSATLAELKGE